MRKLNEVLRLRFELGLGQRAIARACSISQGAVHNYLKKAAAAGFGWPLPEGITPRYRGKLQTVIEDLDLPNPVIRSHYGNGFIQTVRLRSSSSSHRARHQQCCRLRCEKGH
jgi:predicted transcriptional regulator